MVSTLLKTYSPKSSLTWLLASLYAWASMSFISNSALSLHHILSVLAFLIFLTERPKITLQKSQWALLLLSVALALSIFVNWASLSQPLKNLFKIKYVLIAALTGILVNLHRHRVKEHLANLLAFFILSYSIANVWGLLKYTQHILYSPQEEFRLSGFFGMVMSYAYAALLPLGLILFLCLNPKISDNLKKQSSFLFLKSLFSKKILLPLLLLSILTLYLSLSRGPLLGLLIIFPFLLFSKSKKWALIATLCSVTIASAGILLAFNNTEYKSRLLLKASHAGNSDRLAQNKMAFKAFTESPIFGIGYRSLEEKSPQLKIRHNIVFTNESAHAHNNYLEILGSSGLLGFLFFMLWLFYWTLETLKHKEWRSYSLVVIGTFLTLGLFQSTFIDSEYIFTLLALYAMNPLFTDVYFNHK